jgi:hypothetical protein
MALKTVVDNTFVRQLTDFVDDMARSKGPFSLVMLVPSETGLADKWNLVLSARWIDEGMQATIPSNSSRLLRSLTRVNAKKIERISVRRTSDPLVTGLMELDIPPGIAYRVQTTALSILGIEEAIVLVAQSPKSAPRQASRVNRLRK